jgi:hypothetical protein
LFRRSGKESLDPNRTGVEGMADSTDVMEIERIGPGPTERANIAAMLDAIGRAANGTLRDSADLADDAVGRQIRRDLARLGGLVIYASMIREPGTTRDENLAAIIRFGRALRVGVERI